MSQATLGSGPYRNSSLFSGYYLDERVADLDDWESDDEAEAAFEALRELWELEGEYVASHGEDELIDQWIGEVLDILGFDTISEGTLPGGGGYVDRLLYESREARYTAADRKQNDDREGMFSGASALLEAKQWGHDFEARFSDERPYRDASHQVKYYLERTPSDLKWGILTDGRKWRLYGTKDYETQTYYEVDLPELLESGDLQQFKYFYCFFRPEAFTEVAGTSFLETVWTESETAAQELGEDLQDNVFTALRVLGKGFVESNDLAIDPEDESARAELKEQSLVLLYRLMFVLYAESRGLIDPEEPSANAEYHENFSLEEVRSDIIERVEGGDIESGAAFREEYSEFSTTIWNRLSRLFELIDDGEEALDIPPYNGGLFDHDDHEFLAENAVSDAAIAEVIFRLSTTKNDEGEHVPADYADLDTRHLGSIYEGLLEHEFRIAPEAGMAAVAAEGGQVWKPADEVSVADAVETVDGGGLYVVNDEGERKATGAYYTPDYVVTYIVEETVDPLIDEIHADLEADGLARSDTEYFRRFYDRVTDLTVLDPAMGSGHFLTKATGYLTEQVMSVVREQEIQSYDEQEFRRDISKEVIYGVDINGMAVELAKLSMWLETLAADQPLAFLDHHLKSGNSLVGSDITEVLSEDNGDDGGQLTLTQAFARVRQDTLEHVMELMADLLAYDNETLEDVKSMEELYDEIREDPLYKRLFELANVHTAEEFGVDVPEDAYEQMASAIEDERDWEAIREEPWFKSAQTTAAEQNFFHWELEFPEVFFDSEGEKMGEAGFDIVIGNPPYVTHGGKQDTTDKSKLLYYDAVYESSEYKPNTFALFYELIQDVCKLGGRISYITPRTLLDNQYMKNIREILVTNSEIQCIIESDYSIFKNVETGRNVIGIFKKVNDVRSDHSLRVGTISEPMDLASSGTQNIKQDYFLNTPEYKFTVKNNLELELYDKLKTCGKPLGNFVTVNNGVNTGNAADVLISNEPTKETHRRFIEGKDINKYTITWRNLWINYDPSLKQRLDPDDLNTRQNKVDFALRSPELFEDNKILLRQTADKPVGAFDDEGYISRHSTHILRLKEDVSIPLLVILPIFNSSLLQFAYQILVPEKGRTFAEVKATNVRKLPFIIPEQSQKSNKPTNVTEEVLNSDKSGRELAEEISTNGNTRAALTQSSQAITELKNSALNVSVGC
ncbi:type I restriction-modification system DNA methylase subunit [Halorubrum alkaliphilum]|uniref:site-specific DNA-methyltransferase (adenine-specific) n=1 Tax=Halorubrum alkaliphilum TaxID=261290 RepID=A0A8T4GHS1_9EURY|nr:TaqI-like C-terminal specificity domain-containing protein [Halorubrum alkaliphilum]MBP1923289.1 type I restriction-modification system DNA methylase subunit [Halorubrum alkaliphilum]